MLLWHVAVLCRCGANLPAPSWPLQMYPAGVAGAAAGGALESEGEEASELEQFPDTEVVQVRACARATQRGAGYCQAGGAAYSHWGWLAARHD